MPRGGFREGAGRKRAREKRQRVTLSLPVGLVEQIDRLAYTGGNRSEVVARLLRKALET